MRTLRTTRQVARARVIARETAHVRAVASHAESAAARTEARLLAEVERLTAENAELRKVLDERTAR